MKHAYQVILVLAVMAIFVGVGWSAPDFVSSTPGTYRLLGKKDQIPLYKNIGKPVLIVFWASWCPPCLTEVPQLNHLQQTYGPKGLQILGMDMDKESEDYITLMVKRFEITYPVTIPSPELVRDFQVQAIPASYLYDATGQLVQTWLGPPPIEALELQIKKLLGAATPEEKAK